MVSHTKKSNLVSKGLVSMSTLIGYFIVLLFYIVGLYPIIQAQINSFIGDPFTTAILSLVPAGIFIAIVAGIFNYARGQPDPRANSQWVN